MYCLRQYVRRGACPPHPRPCTLQGMAIFHLSAKIIGRKAGRSSVACAAYRAGVALTDARTGETFRFARSERVAHTEILAPLDAPAWARDRADLWNQVEARERRKDAQLAREFEVALPRELSLDQQRELVRGWIQTEISPAGAVADISIHEDKAGNNPHAHIMTTMRPVSAEGWGAQKLRAWEDRSALQRWRASWAEHTNQALARASIEERIDHRSHADRGLKEKPMIKEGPAARGRVDRGEVSDRVARNQWIRKYNLRVRERLAELKRAALARVRAKGPTSTPIVKPMGKGPSTAPVTPPMERSASPPAPGHQPTQPAAPPPAPPIQKTGGDDDLAQQAWWLGRGGKGR